MKRLRSVKQTLRSRSATHENVSLRRGKSQRRIEPKVPDEDDESIDDDGSSVGWNSEDDIIFGDQLGNGRSVDVADSDDDNEEGILLTDIFDKIKNTSKAKDKEKEVKDSEMTEEESDSFSEEGSDGVESTYDEGKGHIDLVRAMEKFAETHTDNTKPTLRLSGLAGKGLSENEFSNTSVRGNSALPEGISMDALLGALGESSATMQRIQELKKSKPAPKAVDKIKADRSERMLTYDQTKAEMDKWKDIVSQNRFTPCLDLSQDRRKLSNYKELIKKFEPATDMEKEVEMVLISTKSTEQDLENQEDELLERNDNIEDIKKKQAELAKIRSLLFYEQMKRHRINKIKSKGYHRIRKRQRQRQGDEDMEMIAQYDPEVANQLMEEEVTKRVKERMDLKHKNTSRWAQMALRFSKSDKSLRSAYHDAVALGHELTKRIHSDPSKPMGNEGGDEYLDDGPNEGTEDEWESEGEQGGDERKKTRPISEVVGKKIQSILDEEDDNNTLNSDSKYNRLLSMDFMKRAKEIQKERAQEDAKLLLKELEALEDDSDSGSEAEELTRKSKQKQLQHLQSDRREGDAPRKAPEIQSLMGQGMTLSRKSVSRSIRVDGNIAVPTVSQSSAAEEEGWDREEGGLEEDSSWRANPWLSGPSRDENISGSRSGTKRSNVDDPVVVTVDLSIAERPSSGIVDNDEKYNMEGQISGKTGSNKTKKKRKTEEESLTVQSLPTSKSKAKKSFLVETSQDELVRAAFLTGPSREEVVGPDLEKEFNETKSKAINEELGVDEKKKKILSEDKAGWGDWAGPGATGISQSTVLKRKRLFQRMEDENKAKKNARADGNKKMLNVMLSERRIKSASKYKLSEIPHPFTSREEYERSLQMPLGEEWNSSFVVQKNTRPEVRIRPGRVIEPLKLTASKKASQPNMSGAPPSIKSKNRKSK